MIEESISGLLISLDEGKRRLWYHVNVRYAGTMPKPGPRLRVYMGRKTPARLSTERSPYTVGILYHTMYDLYYMSNKDKIIVTLF